MLTEKRNEVNRMSNGKTLAIIAAALMLGYLAFNWSAVSIAGSGNIVAQDEPLAGFDAIELSHAFRVNVSRARAFSVRLQVDDNVVPYLRVDTSSDILRIGLKPFRHYRLQDVTLSAEVTLPALRGVELSGASRLSLSGFASDERFRADLSGASALEGELVAGDVSLDLSGGSRFEGTLEARDLRVEASGASRVTLSGTARGLSLDVSGASQIDLSGLPLGDATVDASGASAVTVRASGTLHVDASGASHVSYLGEPTLGRIDTSGGSRVEPR